MDISAATPFSQGTWIAVVLTLFVVVGLRLSRQHIGKVVPIVQPQNDSIDIHTHRVELIVLVNEVHSGTRQLISFAESLGRPWVAVHVAVRPDQTARVLEQWNTFLGDHGSLYVLPSPDRSHTAPIVRLVEEIRQAHPNAFINIIMDQRIPESRWDQLWHHSSRQSLTFAFRRINKVAVTGVQYRFCAIELPGQQT